MNKVPHYYNRWIDRLDGLGHCQIVAATLHENVAIASILYLN